MKILRQHGKEITKEENTIITPDGKKHTSTKITRKLFTGRDKVPNDILQKAKTEGVVQKDKKGNWRIVAIKKGEFWDAHYDTKESAQKALAAYHANK